MLKVMAPKRRTVVDIEFPWYPAHKKRLSQGIHKAPQPLMKIELRVSNKTAPVIKKGDQISLSLFAVYPFAEAPSANDPASVD